MLIEGRITNTSQRHTYTLFVRRLEKKNLIQRFYETIISCVCYFIGRIAFNTNIFLSFSSSLYNAISKIDCEILRMWNCVYD